MIKSILFAVAVLGLSRQAGFAEARELNNDSLPGATKVFVVARSDDEAKSLIAGLAARLGDRVEGNYVAAAEPRAAMVLAVLDMAEKDGAKGVALGAGVVRDAAVAGKLQHLRERGVLILD